MTQPTAEAYEAASTAWLESDGGNKEAVRAAVDAVWPLAVAEGRRLEHKRLASLVEAVRALRRGIGDGGTNRLLAVFVAIDALTREDSEGAQPP